MNNQQRNFELFFLVYDYWHDSRTNESWTDEESQNMETAYNEILLSHPFFTTATKVHISPKTTVPVRRQRKCGCCYGFCVCDSTSNVIATQPLLDGKSEPGEVMVFAPQYFLNSMPNPRDPSSMIGCDGTVITHGYEFASNKGLREEKYLPYTGKPGVDRIVQGRRVRIHGYEHNVGVDIRRVLFKHVVCATIPAYRAFQKFSGQGIYNHDPVDIEYGNISGSPFSYNTKRIRRTPAHSVIVCGWGEDMDGNVLYYIIKNSWGKKWGFRGFARVHPSVLMFPSYPVGFSISDPRARARR